MDEFFENRKPSYRSLQLTNYLNNNLDENQEKVSYFQLSSILFRNKKIALIFYGHFQLYN